MARKPLSAWLLLDARGRANLSQRQLAQRARTAQSVVARIELGRTQPTTDTLERLVNAAGFELAVSLRPRVVLDRQVLDDVPRILRLSPENRLREVANLNRLVASVRRA
jgi:transcriptional regulator with XRE-family HTH domain